MSSSIILILIVSGLFVGFINTLSAGGTAISIALYLALGLPPSEANATNRIGVLLQSSLSAGMFAGKGYLKQTKALPLALFAMLGALVGSILSIALPQQIFSYAMGASLLIMLFFLFSSPKRFEEDNLEKLYGKRGLVHYLVFFLIGIYGGFVQVGTGFFLMAAGTMLLGCNIIRTNAIKSFVMTLYTIVAIFVFMQHGSTNWQYGLLHSVGTLVGSYIATRLAFKKGAGFIRWIVIIVIVFTSLYLFKIINLEYIFRSLIR